MLKGSILNTIICIYIVHEFCIQIVYIMFMKYTFCGSRLMYTEYLYTKCIPHFYKQLLYTFCIQNPAGIVLLILYRKCVKKLSKCGIFCVHFIYIFYVSVVYILYNFYIQNVYTVLV